MIGFELSADAAIGAAVLPENKNRTPIGCAKSLAPLRSST